MKKRVILILIVVVIVGLSGYFLFFGKNEKVEDLYRTQEILQEQLRIAVSATGTVQPVLSVSVGTQVSGTVTEIFVDYNDEVKAGQPLLILEGELFSAKVNQSEANVASSKAQLKLSEANLRRYKKLHLSRAITTEELDQMEANEAIARAQVKQTEAQLAVDKYNQKNSHIVSPVDGVVINKEVEIGQTVAASFQTPTLIEIAQDLTRMQIDASFAEADIGRLQSGLESTFTVDAFSGKKFKGKVRQIRLNPANVQNVVTYNVIIDVDNPDLELLPGMTAYVDIELYRADNVLLVPNAAFHFSPKSLEGNNLENTNEVKKDESDLENTNEVKKDEPNLENTNEVKKENIYVLRNNKLEKISISTGKTDLRKTIILEGDLKAGDLVVVAENEKAEKAGFKAPRGRGGF